MNEEFFDVVDPNDNVIDQAPRSFVHAKKLLHRAVSIFVFNSRGELLLQKRSASKDEYPGCYTSSASGHVSAGETYDETAPRELAEELGISAPLEYLTKFPAGSETANEHTALYRTTTDLAPQPDPGEIESVLYVGLSDLRRQVETEPDLFTPPFRTAFRWYCDRFAPELKSS
ncbi:MAG: NUDIX domain-containing protein [Planctomycetaceae bacterium]